MPTRIHVPPVPEEMRAIYSKEARRPGGAAHGGAAHGGAAHGGAAHVKELALTKSAQKGGRLLQFITFLISRTPL